MFPKFDYCEHLLLFWFMSPVSMGKCGYATAIIGCANTELQEIMLNYFPKQFHQFISSMSGGQEALLILMFSNTWHCRLYFINQINISSISLWSSSVLSYSPMRLNTSCLLAKYVLSFIKCLFVFSAYCSNESSVLSLLICSCFIFLY